MCELYGSFCSGSIDTGVWHCGGSEKFSVLCRYVKPDIQGALLFTPHTTNHVQAQLRPRPQ